jgi:hypothetical protein
MYQAPSLALIALRANEIASTAAADPSKPLTIRIRVSFIVTVTDRSY